MFDRRIAAYKDLESRTACNSYMAILLRIGAMLLIPAGLHFNANAQAPAQLAIDVTKIVTPVSPTLYGLMTEEINHSYDGGLYAEMIQNRAFHSDWQGEPPWDLVRHGNAAASQVCLINQPDRAPLCHFSMKLSVTEASKGNQAGLTNPGYWGYGRSPKHHILPDRSTLTLKTPTLARSQCR